MVWCLVRVVLICEMGINQFLKCLFDIFCESVIGSFDGLQSRSIIYRALHEFEVVPEGSIQKVLSLCRKFFQHSHFALLMAFFQRELKSFIFGSIFCSEVLLTLRLSPPRGFDNFVHYRQRL